MKGRGVKLKYPANIKLKRDGEKERNMCEEERKTVKRD